MRIALMSRKRTLYSSKRLIQEIKAKSATPVVLNPLKCDLFAGNNKHDIFYKSRRVTGIDVVIPRIGSSITRYGLNVLRQFTLLGVPTISDPECIAASRNRFHSMQLLDQSGIQIPKTIMLRDPDSLEKAIDRVGGAPVIIKLMKGTHGIGVMLAESKKSAVSTLETLWSLGQQIVIQEFIIESKGTDIRSFVVDGEIVASCLRTARIGEFRANFHQGSIVEPFELSEEQKACALDAAKCLGVGVAGIDLLESARGTMVLDVNVSPGFEGLERATGINVAEKIIDFAIRKAEEGNV